MVHGSNDGRDKYILAKYHRNILQSNIHIDITENKLESLKVTACNCMKQQEFRDKYFYTPIAKGEKEWSSVLVNFYKSFNVFMILVLYSSPIISHQFTFLFVVFVGYSFSILFDGDLHEDWFKVCSCFNPTNKYSCDKKVTKIESVLQFSSKTNIAKCTEFDCLRLHKSVRMLNMSQQIFTGCELWVSPTTAALSYQLLSYRKIWNTRFHPSRFN